VLFLTVDTLRADHMGCYGYRRETTPFLDELAGKSTRFEWAVVQWPKTGPSFASMFSSTYGSTSGVKQRTGRIKVPDAFDLLSECFQQAGYQTLAVVSNSSLTTLLGYGQGFDRYVEDFFIETGSAAKINETVKEQLSSRDRSRPFYLWAHYIDPHTPYEAPAEYVQMFQGDPVYQEGDAREIPKFIPDVSKGGQAMGQVPPAAQRDDCEEVRDYVLQYDAEVRFFDDQMRALFDWMEENGHLDRTIVVFTSDHGESLGDHEYFFEHGAFPYDACSRVPLFLHHPDLPPCVIEEPVALLDVAPTLLDMVDFPRPPLYEGRSVLDWIRGCEVDEPRPVITESGYKETFTVAIRRGRWKMIRISDPALKRLLTGDEYELYDLEEDPLETRNVYAEHPEIVEKMKPLLDRETEARHGREGVAQLIEGGKLPDEMEEMLQALGYVDGD
jgi:arylsulfatase A-like enzyme